MPILSNNIHKADFEKRHTITINTDNPRFNLRLNFYCHKSAVVKNYCPKLLKLTDFFPNKTLLTDNEFPFLMSCFNTTSLLSHRIKAAIMPKISILKSFLQN